MSLTQIPNKPPPLSQTNDHAFLVGGGALGDLIRSYDWSRSPLGAPDRWSQSLKTSVSTCLNCAFPVIIFWGPQLIQVYNNAYAPILGGKHPDSLGAPARQVWPEIWDVVGPMIEGVMREGRAVGDKDLLLPLHRRGFTEECYFSFSYSPIRDESGDVVGVFCPVMETTERVIGERRLQLLRKLAELAADGSNSEAVCAKASACIGEVCSYDLPFAAFYILPEFNSGEARLAATAGIPAGHPSFPDTIDPRVGAGSPWPFAEVSQRRLGLVVEIAANGSLPTGLLQGTIERAVVLPLGASAGGRLRGFMVAGLNPLRPFEEVHGFSELVAQQVSAAIGNAEALESERRRSEALAQLDRAKSVFFSNVSHEFRTPLTLLLGPLEDALSSEPSELSPRLRRELEMGRRNARRLRKLVNDLLEFSRIEAGRANCQPEPTDIAAFTADLASGFRSACEHAGLRLDVDCPTSAGLVSIDREMWEKVVLNLLSNAFKFTFTGGIKVRLERDGPYVVLQIEDTGVGIPATELPRLFDRFHRIEGQRSRTHEGSGIGLALVQELVHLHGGKVGATSEEGKGATFVVTIPAGSRSMSELRPAADIATGAPRSANAEVYVAEALSWLPDTTGVPKLRSEDLRGPIADQPDGSSRSRILVADDNADMRGYIVRLLSETCDVEAVADGQAALEAATRLPPDLIVADVMMPGLDGLQLTRAIRAAPELKDISIIMLSARSGQDARNEGLGAGVDDYMFKPFSAVDLQVRVAAMLALAGQRREAARKIAETEANLRRMFEQAPSFMALLKGPNHRIEFANGAYQRLVGPREVLGKTVAEALPDAASQGFVDILDVVFRTGTPYTAQGARWRAEVPGMPPVDRFADFIYQPITDDRGIVTGIFVEGSDVTDRVRAESEQQATQDALRASEDALRQLNEKLEVRIAEEVSAREQVQGRLAQSQRMEALGKLAGGVAHDFNNVLQAVGGALGLIQRRANDPKAIRQLTEMALDAADRGSAITGRLLSFARRGELRAQPLSPAALLQNLREILLSTLGTEVAVQVEVAADLPAIMADKAQLETVLINLGVNARDAMPSGGTLIVSALPDSAETTPDFPKELGHGAFVRFCVADTGVGMSAETLARASEPFFTTKPDGQGTGLGLAMARGFATQSGGGFRIESEQGRGTCVTLWFPQAEGDRDISASEPAPAGAFSGLPAVRVLVVDDDVMVLEVIAGQLQELGCEVVAASDGLSALRLLDAGDAVDLLVTDLSMPGMNGLVLIDEVRRRFPTIPALLLTGYADQDISFDAATNAQTVLLRKPVIFDVFEDRIRELLIAARMA